MIMYCLSVDFSYGEAVNIRFLSIVILLATCTTVSAQDNLVEKEKQLSYEVNRIQTFFMIAQDNFFSSDQIEVTKNQTEQFKELLKKREFVHETMNGLAVASSIQERVELLRVIKAKLTSLRSELTEDILLPHQSIILLHREFSDLLQALDGNYELVFERYFGEKFGLTQDQKARIEEVELDSDEKAKIVIAKYQAEMRKIRAERRSKVSKIFTARQKQLIQKYSGVDFDQVQSSTKEK